MSEPDCGCGWVATEHGRAFVQCPAHVVAASAIAAAIGAGNLWRFDSYDRQCLDAEVEDRLRRGFKGVDHKPSPLGRIR